MIEVVINHKKCLDYILRDISYKRRWDEYVRKHIERLKQTGEYDELVKRRQAVLDAQKNKEE